MAADGPWVLVTDGGTGGSRDALAAARGLASAGYRVGVTVSGRSWPPPSRRAARRVPVPSVASPGYADAVRAQAVAGGYAAVLPASEAALTALGVSLPHLLDKEGLARAALEVGLEVPPQQTFPSTSDLLAAAPDLGYPVVVKPRTRRYLAFRADGPEGLARAPLDGGPVVVQPFLAHGLGAVAGVMWQGRLLAAVHERWLRIWPYPCGLACAAETVAPDLDVEDRLAALLRGHDGLFCAQFAGRFLFDVNMRIHSSHPLAVAAGANLAALYVDAVRGEPRSLARARPGHFYRWLEGDVRHVADAVRRGRMEVGTALAALRPRPGAAHSTESLADPGPMLSRLWYSVRRVHLSPDARALGAAPPAPAPPAPAPPRDPESARP